MNEKGEINNSALRLKFGWSTVLGAYGFPKKGSPQKPIAFYGSIETHFLYFSHKSKSLMKVYYVTWYDTFNFQNARRPCTINRTTNTTTTKITTRRLIKDTRESHPDIYSTLCCDPMSSSLLIASVFKGSTCKAVENDQLLHVKGSDVNNSTLWILPRGVSSLQIPTVHVT